MKPENKLSNKEFIQRQRKMFLERMQRKQKNHRYQKFHDGSLIFYAAELPKYARLYSNTALADFKFRIYDFNGFTIGSIPTCRAANINEAIQYFKSNKSKVANDFNGAYNPK